MPLPPLKLAAAVLFVCSLCGASAKIGGWDTSPNAQYHIQTDEGPERYFKYQTVSGQYRKEKRLQDGTVIGSYGWVDADGFLRLRDYIADDKGYRIVRTKMIHVGTDEPIGQAVAAAKETPRSRPAPVAAKPVYERPKPVTLNDYLRTPQVEVNHNGFPSTTQAPSYSTTTVAPITSTESSRYTSTPDYVPPVTFRPYINLNSIDYDQKAYDTVGAARYETNGVPSNVEKYDGVSMTHNGFRYYLPRHYHEEETLANEQRAGSFGYVDPFGIRRVIYYNTSPGSGFVHRKNNRYVGFQSTPYDPRF